MPISAETYEQLSLEDDDEQWELVCGRLRRKPGTTIGHNEAVSLLDRQLVLQLDPAVYVVRQNSARLRISSGTYFVPDLCVLPRELVRRTAAARPNRLEVYDEPLPLVVEVWSPSTGEYDVDEKLREYQLRGDAEIWRLHPVEHTLTTWRRLLDGSHAETLVTEGSIEPAALPGVCVELTGFSMM